MNQNQNQNHPNQNRGPNRIRILIGIATIVIVIVVFTIILIFHLLHVESNNEFLPLKLIFTHFKHILNQKFKEQLLVASRSESFLFDREEWIRCFQRFGIPTFQIVEECTGNEKLIVVSKNKKNNKVIEVLSDKNLLVDRRHLLLRSKQKNIHDIQIIETVVHKHSDPQFSTMLNHLGLTSAKIRTIDGLAIDCIFTGIETSSSSFFSNSFLNGRQFRVQNDQHEEKKSEIQSKQTM